ncbi:MAG TPA: glycosyl hydrolase [Flavobacterium sp.]|uniref:glycosyl hydrolase n=1 Tax=Flavobacterium sp. TaxID=239 RepID=UPI002DBB0539|nr:glycosyl hydrolase [Flavobacterium sp.]HEU4790726.1 glycosyl hydrolase [Flavobacterium sp.]
MKYIHPINCALKKIVLVTMILFLGITTISAQSKKNSSSKWLPYFDFNLVEFYKPLQEYGPFARWWWPGNDVTKEELQREINLFADNGFAGVEVQPLVIGIPMNSKVRARVQSWDTPEYYENLKTVMEVARKRNMTVDITNGSGWPPGGSFLNAEDGFLSLEFSEVKVDGGKKMSVSLPAVENKSSVQARLQAVVVAKILTSSGGEKNQVRLDPNSAQVVTSFVMNNTLSWTFPTGQWKVICFWSIPSGEQTNIAASPDQGPVLDHFSTQKVIKSYEHLFGERTGLQPYFGNPMRAVFNDSYEFKANRHYSLDFISFFKKNRGYDISPWLPANMQKGYNFVLYLRPDAKPDFYFSDEDWRLRYDYDLTLSELLGEHFFKTSKNWMEKQGLMHRTQAYGLNMDMIAMAGSASIPETESMLGAEANLKVMTSGSLLYNRPLMTAESTVAINQAYTTTPQKVRLAIDKLFAVGVNQVIYHGVPYRYTPDKLGPEGWYPFSTPFLPMINFSSNLGEGNIFWKYQKDINEYVSRIQYVLRSGKAHADVLIYYPFMNVEGMPENPEEIFTKGYIEDKNAVSKEALNTEKLDPEKVAWAAKAYPLINELEAKGISWIFVNDASIQVAKLDKDQQINIRGNHFQTLMLINTPVIQLKTAQQIKLLANKGMYLLATGVLPTKQPSFLNWNENDQKTAQSIKAALKSKNSIYIQNEKELDKGLQHFNQSVRFNDSYHFTRQVQREMTDGSRVHFIWNKSNQWQTMVLTLAKKFKSSFWMNAETGAVIKNEGSTIQYRIAPYSSVILFASTTTKEDKNQLSTLPILADNGKEILSIDQWDVKADNIEIKETSLFDWKTNEKLKYSSAEGIYNSKFQWQPDNSSKRYFLDLGSVCYTAEVFINGKYVGNRIFAPYIFDVTSFLKSGTNLIEVHITPGQLNGFISNAKNGDKRYVQFKGKENEIMSAGLIGPVVIRSNK